MNRFKSECLQAFRNIFRNKRRSLVTALAIMSGFVGLTLLSGYVARVERYLMVNTVYLNHNGHISIFKKDSIDKYFSRPGRYLINQDELESIQKIISSFSEKIEQSFPYMMSNGILQVGSTSYPFQGKGVTPESDHFTRNHPMVEEWTAELRNNEEGPTFLEAKDNHNPVKLTHRLSRYFNNVNDIQMLGLTVENDLNALDATVVGRYSTGLDLTEETSILASYDIFQELMATDGLTHYSLFLKSDLDTRGLVKKLNQKFIDKNLEVEAFPYSDERIGLFYTGTMNFLYAMAAFFFSLVSLVVILSIANVISMNIVERIKELGTMRAIGYTPKDIARLMALENLFLSLGAIGIGFIFAQIVAVGVNLANIRFYPPGIAGDMQFVLTPWPTLCLALAIPLILITFLTAYLVTRSKIQGEVAALLSETTT